MEPLGVLFLAAGAFIAYSGLHSIKPVQVAEAIAKDPANAQSIISGAVASAKAEAVTAATGSVATASGASAAPVASGTPQSYAQSRLAAYGWDPATQWQPLLLLWNRESGWRVDAKNASSGAYGIPQALPASKMASAGSDYLTNFATQINWGLSYIKSRYGSPASAWAHETSVGWY